MLTRKSVLSLLLALVSTTALAQLRGPTNQMLIPAAGNVAGANGTYFRSDVTLTNFRDSNQRVQLQWIPQTPSGTTPMPAPVTLTIPAHTGIASEDFVTNYLSQTGLGAVLITGVDASDAIDAGALLFATARIWSPQPGSAGSVSQSFPIVPVGALNPASTVIILGNKIDNRFRTNVGIVNLETGYFRTFDILQSSDNPNFAPIETTVTVPPMSMLQFRLQDFQSRALQVTITPQTPPVPFPGFKNVWVAYASTVDNVTGDAWSNLAMPLVKP